MAKLYCIVNEAMDKFYVVAANLEEANTSYQNFVASDATAPQGDGTSVKEAFLVASDVIQEVAPWATFVNPAANQANVAAEHAADSSAVKKAPKG